MSADVRLGVDQPVAIRPFRAAIPEDRLREMRRRISATQWPERETVADESQGVPLVVMQLAARSDLLARSCRVSRMLPSDSAP
jgi:hypothetical protein